MSASAGKGGGAKKQDKPSKPSSLALKGFKWVAENYGEGVVQFEKAEMKHDVGIYGCMNSGFMVPKKVRSVAIDGCKKIQVEVNDVVSSLEMVNSSNVTVFVKGNVQSIAVDKCDNPKLVIFKSALQHEPKIITSMVSDMNIEVEGETEDADWTEIAVPYQFETMIDKQTRKAKTTPVMHA